MEKAAATCFSANSVIGTCDLTVQTLKNKKLISTCSSVGVCMETHTDYQLLWT